MDNTSKAEVINLPGRYQVEINKSSVELLSENFVGAMESFLEGKASELTTEIDSLLRSINDNEHRINVHFANNILGYNVLGKEPINEFPVDIPKLLSPVQRKVIELEAVQMAMDKKKNVMNPVREAYNAWLEDKENPLTFINFKQVCETVNPRQALDGSEYMLKACYETAHICNGFIASNVTSMTDEDLFTQFNLCSDIVSDMNRDESYDTARLHDELCDIGQVIKSEMARRYNDDNVINETYKEQVMESMLISEAKENILNANLINPYRLKDDIERMSGLLESYNRNFSRCGAMLVKILPSVTMCQKEFPEFCTESFNNIATTIQNKIIDSNDGAGLIKYNSIIMENYNMVKDSNPNYAKSLLDLSNNCEETINDILKRDSVALESVGLTNDAQSELLTDIMMEAIMNIEMTEEPTFEAMTRDLLKISKVMKKLDIQSEDEITLEAAGVNGHKSKTWQVSNKVDKASRKLKTGAKNQYDSSVRNMAGIKKAKENVETIVNYPINKFIQMDRQERKERIISGTFRSKLWKWFRRAIEVGVVYKVFNPMASVIWLIGRVAVDKATDMKTKRNIINEIETEIKVVEAKLEDANSEADKKEKYQLIRIKADLEKERDRIKYSLGAK